MIEARIVDPPAIFLKKVGGMSDAKGLENIHRLLHAWETELSSASPRTLIGNGWTIRTVTVAHNAVVARLKELKPNFDHQSPIQAAKLTLQTPILLSPGYITLVGSTLEGKEGADKDVVVKAEKAISAALEAKIAEVLGGKAHIIYDESGPREEGVPLYHLALIPSPMWGGLSEGSPLSAALAAYRLALGEAYTSASFSRRAILGTGALRAAISLSTPIEKAQRQGTEMARKVLSDESLEARPRKHHLLIGSWDIDGLYKIATEVYVGLIGPVTDYLVFSKGLKDIFKQLEEWYEEDPFKDKDEAEDAARELGVFIAKKGGKNSGENT